MKAALVGADGTLLHEARRATGRDRGAEAVVETILGFAADLYAYGEEHLGEGAVAAGVAVPGIIDAERGIAVYAANLGWRDVPCGSCSANGSAASPSRSATTSGPAASPRGGSGPTGARTASCSCPWAPGSSAP